MYSRARLSPLSALAAEDSSVCRARFAASIVRWTWVSMKPGLTVRWERSITRAPGGRPTDRSIFAIRLSSTRISAGPVRASEMPSNTLPHTRTNAFISTPPRAVILPILRRTQFCGRWLGFVGDRKVPAAANSHEPEPEAEDRAGNRHRGRREPRRGADDDHGRAGQSGDGVKIGAQYGGNFDQKHIAGHAAADPGQHAEERRHDRVEPEAERLLRTGNREETQPSGVEQEHRAAQPVDDGGAPEGG